ncbi:chemotaxis protein CheB [Streptomyces sp. NPDC087300]|uniref:chemotaxis protein CheB n=1 Tax=Streptomyces sp. NPDC087300 TaxID=3365780 RepID=UPI00380ACDD3
MLTDTDSEGARGVEAVKEHGGTVIVQDPETDEFHGMPTATVRTARWTTFCRWPPSPPPSPT